MFDLDTWHEIISTIIKNKWRSVMTAFGVFWGIFMLVIMSGSGIGISNGMAKGVKNFSTNSLFVFTGKTSIPYKGFQKGRSWSLENDDIKMLQNSFPDVKYISAIIWGGKSDNNIVYGDKYGTFEIRGTGPDFMKIDAQNMLYGRMINQIDMDEKRKVCVIGEKVYDNFFKKGMDPIGELLKINGINYTIIGVNQPLSKNINFGEPTESIVTLPTTTIQQAQRLGNNIHALGLTMNDNISADEIDEKVKMLIKNKHYVSPDDNQAVSGFNVAKMFKSFQMLVIGTNVLIWIVGIGTLFAGIVGVCNIMLITVKERTTEIGVRRAIGATPRQIIFQIMSESVVLTSLAGLVGLCGGVLLLYLLNLVLISYPSEDRFFIDPMVSFSTAVMSVIVLIISGLLAGLLPSYKAMLIKPIDALRYE